MTLRVRDEQSAALRRAQVARDLCAVLEQAGDVAAYDVAANVVRATDKVGRTSRYHLSESGPLAGYSTPLGRFSRLAFDDQNHLTELVEPSGRKTQIAYDERGIPARFTREGLELARFAWNEQLDQNRTDFWDGSRASGAFTGDQRPLRLTNRLEQTQTFEYDALGLLSVLRDPRGRETHFGYDEFARPSVTTHADGRSEAVTYDDQGHCATYALNGRHVFDRQGNAANRPLKLEYADGNNYAFAYDDAGRLLSAAGPNGKSTWVYGEEGRLLSETNDDQTFRFEYDPTGLLTGIEYPDGTKAMFGYDADKRVSQAAWSEISTSFEYDSQDRARWIATQRFQTEVLLHPSGKPSRVTVTDRASRNVTFETHYGYDVQGRLVGRSDRQGGDHQFVYDAESQLLGVVDGSGAWRESFAYDSAGNRTHAGGEAVLVDGGNRVLRQGALGCEYDERGNLVRSSTETGSVVFGYDLKNQLVEASGPSGVVSFKYDALGRRIEKKSAVKTVRYVWLGELLAREIVTTASGESVRDYLYHPGSYEPLALRVDGRCYHYHNDHLGTPRALTDEQGNVVWRAEYSAFGLARVEVAVVENPLRFAGQYADVETGLHYNRFRYYSPVLGRYTSVDPIGLGGGPNLYLYVGNDPLNRSDPLGLFWKEVGIFVAAAAVATVAVVLAPAIVPFLAVAAIAVPLGFAIGTGIAEYQSIGHFCKPCFWKGVKNTFPAAAGLALIGGIVLAGVAAPVAAVIGVGFAAVAIYSTLDHHFGWSSGKPFDQMTDDEKSESLGELTGGTTGGIVGGVVGGAVGKGIMGLRTPAPVPKTGGTGGPEPGVAGEPAAKPVEPEPVVVNKTPDPATVERCGPPQDPVFTRPGEGTRPPTARDAAPGQPMELDPNVTDRYLYVVNPDGTITYAPQSRVGSPTEIVKHVDLTSKGPARVSGELIYDQATDTWTMDGASGRYSTQAVPEGSRNLVQNRTPDNVKAASELANQTGTKNKIVPNDKVFP